MTKQSINISGKDVSLYFDANFSSLNELIGSRKAIFITDANVFFHQKNKFNGVKTIVIEAGEAHKQQATVNKIIESLIAAEADRSTVLIGVGGGVVTDITGYVASVYMRGISFGFVPSSILAMVDAAVGGKNGIDSGVYKNLVGTINQPDFLFYDYNMLNTLPETEWVNGFAEIIKHAAIKDDALFAELKLKSINEYKIDKVALDKLIQRNVNIKLSVVVEDPFEKADRRLLNFGHTFGHAIENTYHLAHGHAISFGMVIAAKLSEEINGFYSDQKTELISMLEQYQLTTRLEWDKEKVFSILKMDKKRIGESINFVLLDKIGKAVYTPISLVQLEDFMNQNF